MGSIIAIFLLIVLPITMIILNALKNHPFGFYTGYILLSILVLSLELQSEQGELMVGVGTFFYAILLFVNLLISTAIFFVSGGVFHENDSASNSTQPNKDFFCCNKKWDGSYSFCPLCGKKFK